MKTRSLIVLRALMGNRIYAHRDSDYYDMVDQLFHKFVSLTEEHVGHIEGYDNYKDSIENAKLWFHAK